MMRARADTLYRNTGVGLFRAAARQLSDDAETCPDFADAAECLQWLGIAWADPELAAGVRVASPSLAGRLDDICAGALAADKQVRRAAMSLSRYALRSRARQTPFGLFAGVAPLRLGTTTQVLLTGEHRVTARADTAWLADVIDRLETCPELLDHLSVTFNTLCIERDSRLEIPRGASKATIRATKAVQLIRSLTDSPVTTSTLLDALDEAFPAAGTSRVREVVTSLVGEGFLITCLRAPLTVTDPLSYLLDRLSDAKASSCPAGPLLDNLELIHADLANHNSADVPHTRQTHLRASTVSRARGLSEAGRSPLAVDLRLDGDVQIPEQVARELEKAADALLRLSRHPGGQPAWRSYHAAFCERYGIGALVRVTDVTDPVTGLGLPHGYAGSTMPAPTGQVNERDGRLLALAWEAIVSGSREVVLDHDRIRALAPGDDLTNRAIPPHIEMAARIRASSREALDRGDFLLMVSPARSAGTLTSRFSTMATKAALGELYADLPAAVDGALQGQLSFPPVYAHAENVCRVPAYLPTVVSLGEYRATTSGIVTMDDLAVTATPDRLHLVSLSRRQTIEPQVFHALALEKQPPPIARFIAQISRGLHVAWHEFDWGPLTEHLPYLPRVRYSRSVLSPARWHLNTSDAWPTEPGPKWRRRLTHWREQWACPPEIELTDADRSLRLNLDLPGHCAILHAHLRQSGKATLTEIAERDDFGWIDGHAHDVVMPLVSTLPPQARVSLTGRPMLTNQSNGQLPGSRDADWLQAKIYSHPDQLDEIIAHRFPALLDLAGDRGCWFIRYRSQHERDHLRLRLSMPDSTTAHRLVGQVADWVQDLRNAGLASSLTFDTYNPEIGRYGDGAGMKAAEDVFAADSRAVADQLRQLPHVHRDVLTAMNMVGIAEDFFGDRLEAMTWLVSRSGERQVRYRYKLGEEVAGLVRYLPAVGLPEWLHGVADTWHDRSAALVAYRLALPTSKDAGTVLASLLHMHHNRLSGIDRENDDICSVLARQAALTWLALNDDEAP